MSIVPALVSLGTWACAHVPQRLVKLTSVRRSDQTHSMAECSTPWSTTNSVYGAAYPRLALPSPRAKGCPIGAGRPFPLLNDGLLSPRVPTVWMLEPGNSQLRLAASGQASPRTTATGDGPMSRDDVVALISARGGDKRHLKPSSQRDAARGYSAMLATATGGSDDPPLRARSSCDAWWSLGRGADVGPRHYGA